MKFIALALFIATCIILLNHVMNAGAMEACMTTHSYDVCYDQINR